jgi:hypothetical protein
MTTWLWVLAPMGLAAWLGMWEYWRRRRAFCGSLSWLNRTLFRR